MNVSDIMDLPLNEGLALFDQHLQRALQNLQQNGFYMPHPPSYQGQGGVSVWYRGEMPHDISELSDQQLGWYLSMLASWGGYVQSKLAEADLNRSNTEEKLKFLQAKLHVALIGEKHGNKSLTVGQVNAIVVSDRRYVEIRTAYIEFEAQYKIIKAATESADSNWWTISRRITQRGQELERDRRTPTGNIPNGPLFGRRPA
jgi:hypothetical protein